MIQCSKLYTVKDWTLMWSVCIFSLLFSMHFLGYWHGEFFDQPKAFLIGDHFLYSHDLNVWFRGDAARRNYTLVTLRGQRVKVNGNKTDKPEERMKIINYSTKLSHRWFCLTAFTSKLFAFQTALLSNWGLDKKKPFC